MSERGRLVVPSDTSRHQALAADPAWSIWVSANAGSGKTFVLTRRVLRLLLSGVAPEAILCLTYTKAAAAEMRRRVADRLAEWALFDDSALDKALRDIEGREPDAALRNRARTLFARALETPGGLKIVTIHAFCESVLHRFPLEAGVPFDFSVIEDDERTALLLAARETVLAQGLGVAGAVETLFETLSDDQIKNAINAALADGRKLKLVLADPARAKANLRALIGAAATLSVDEIEAAITGERLIGPADLQALFAITPPKGGNRSLEDKLAALDASSPAPDAWLRAFLTKDLTLPSRLVVKAVTTANPDLADQLQAEAERLAALAAARSAAALVDRSEALLDIVAAVGQRYEATKRARSLLDFDDLVERLADLFQNQSGDWVRYKLDSGIDHILVDESQDTNGEQWRVVRAIAEEYFAGAGAVTRPRSLFAVGDQKQSIYSFQGAEPALFGQTGGDYQLRAREAEVQFQPVPLRTSFRTLPEILAAVDLVSDRPDIQAALLETEKVHHNTARTMRGGSVTLWPPIQQPGEARADADWPTSVLDLQPSAPRQVAEAIAARIRGWIDARRPLTGRGRAVTADDVLILVQSRGPVFQEVIRALRKAGLPTPGADRLGVTGHIAVLDLLALCDVLLNPADDLQLAALLRSPLFDIDEDLLFAVAQPRADRQTLWQALAAHADPAAVAAAERLARWRGELDFERPFEFLAQVLYAEGGLRRFHTRFGPEVDDIVAELLELALSHEQGAQPSLQGFVADMRQRSGTIKRELPDAGAGVRVMTVHGAKGLEAPIVILADAATKPSKQMLGKPVYLLAEAPGPLLVHAAGKGDHVEATLGIKQAVDDNLEREYWRKLYVAMTRAEDELYVTGALTPGSEAATQLAGSWYEAVETALRPLSETQTDDAGVETAIIYPRERIAPVPVPDSAPTADAGLAPLVLPPLPPAPVITRVSPSQAATGASATAALDSLAEQLRDAEAARREGIALHALLQHLGTLDRAIWPAIAEKALMALLPDSPADHPRLATKAMSILRRPALARLFGPMSRAEVPFALDLLRDGEPVRLSGRIDRLVIDEQGVLVVDYKSDASVPQTVAEVPGNYITQLGLYALVAGQLFPGQVIRAAILWTSLESLMNLPSDVLVAGARGFTMR
ncbi:double-strand break repair helicase AddA [Devosia sp. FKR38]|uniref:double-strand break repair helicase AddA n=1 Tax=Devosia sp. FKR38 TaxID=2562312 RepID=UPI0014854854|nr:double-strand break repair helicase AddA [Devosia sp. FKR38]